MGEGGKHTSLFFVSISAPRTAALSHLPPRCVLKLPVQSNHKSFDECISPSAKFWCDTFTCRNKKTHTWGKIHTSSRSKIITALTGESSLHIILSSLQFLIWFDIWIRWCDVHIFSEVRRACVCCHAESLRERWWPAHRAPLKALISAARHPHRGKICNINQLISGSAGICIPGLVWWMNHFLSSLSQNTLCPKAGLWRTSNTDRDVKGGENTDSELSWIQENPLRGETCWEEENVFVLDVFKDFFFFLGDGSVSTGIIQEKWQFNFAALFPLCLSLCVSLRITHFA